MSLQDRTQLFDQWARNYDATVIGATDFPFDGYEELLDTVARMADVEPGMRVLDLGIGTGNLAARVARQDCDVWGIDMSPAMLAMAQKRLPDVHLLQMALPGEWPSELPRSFDRVVSSYLLHEFDLATKVQLLRTIATEILAPNGRILIADIGFATTEDRSIAAEQWADRWDPDEYYWAADEAVETCTAAGFDVTYTPVSSCGGIFTFADRTDR